MCSAAAFTVSDRLKKRRSKPAAVCTGCPSRCPSRCVFKWSVCIQMVGRTQSISITIQMLLGTTHNKCPTAPAARVCRHLNDKHPTGLTSPSPPMHVTSMSLLSRLAMDLPTRPYHSSTSHRQPGTRPRGPCSLIIRAKRISLNGGICMCSGIFMCTCQLGLHLRWQHPANTKAASSTARKSQTTAVPPSLI